MPKQKFHKGDLVRVAKDLGSCMSHFTSDCDAIIQYSYNDRYGGGGTSQYSIYIKGEGSTAWYYEDQLTLIEAGRHDLIKTWKKEAGELEKVRSDLDWIFSNGSDVLLKGYGASISTLAACFGCYNLWGSNGEGFVYYENAMRTLAVAKPFLETGDKEGWLEYCEELKNE